MYLLPYFTHLLHQLMCCVIDLTQCVLFLNSEINSLRIVSLFLHYFLNLHKMCYTCNNFFCVCYCFTFPTLQFRLFLCDCF